MRATRVRRGRDGAWSRSGWIALREREPRAAAVAEPAPRQPAAALAVAPLPSEPPLDARPVDSEPPLGQAALEAAAAIGHHAPLDAMTLLGVHPTNLGPAQRSCQRRGHRPAGGVRPETSRPPTRITPSPRLLDGVA